VRYSDFENLKKKVEILEEKAEATETKLEGSVI
jgi:hypothetical protein